MSNKVESSSDSESLNNVPVEELAHFSNDKVDALISLLIRKKIISEDDLNSEYESLFEEDEENNKDREDKKED